MSPNIESPGLAIIVDPWPGPGLIFNQCYSNILECIQSHNIETVILANYVFNFFTHYNTVWMNSAHQMFYSGRSLDKGNQWRQAILNNSSINFSLPWSTDNNNLVKDGGGKDTAEIILDCRLDCLQLLCHRIEDVSWYINCIAPHIQNIWYFGQLWDICVKDRPLGYKSMAKAFPNKTHLTKQNCVVTSAIEHPTSKDMKHWKPFQTDIYYLDLHGEA
jgi:hypothetical protein